jgi:hypothetical protein
VLEATADCSAWTPLLTNSAGTLDYADLAALGLPLRFCRLRQAP